MLEYIPIISTNVRIEHLGQSVCVNVMAFATKTDVPWVIRPVLPPTTTLNRFIYLLIFTSGDDIEKKMMTYMKFTCLVEPNSLRNIITSSSMKFA